MQIELWGPFAEGKNGLDVFDFALSDDDVAKIATLDEDSSQFFDHRDPDMVRWLSARRLG